MSLVRSKLFVTYSSPRSRYATRPRRISGVGLVLIISLAMDQIFCLAPSINPLIDPVVSSTKQTSIRGLEVLGAPFLGLDNSFSLAAPRRRAPRRVNIR